MAIAPARSGDRQIILIVGAGIGGLTAALAIAAAGFRVVVCERSAKPSELGAGIQIAPNAGRILARLGLDKALAGAAIEPKAIDVRNGASGKLLTAIAASAFRARYDCPYRVIHRADLQSILLAAIARVPAITLVFGSVAEGFVAQPDGLLVRLRRPDGGGEVVSAAAMIGADGVWSSLREKVPGSARPQATGRTAWRAIVPADVARAITATDRTGLWLGPDAHLVHYPVAQGAALNIVAIVEEAWDKPGWNAPGDAAAIAERFAGWSKEARDLIAAPVSWQKFAILVVEPRAPWIADRLALLGDAAHAMTPFLAQGAAMAIEDAAVLADALYGTEDIPGALMIYQAKRRPRVTAVARAARRTGEGYHWGSPLAALRDRALAVAGPRLIFRQTDWIYRWRTET